MSRLQSLGGCFEAPQAQTTTAAPRTASRMYRSHSGPTGSAWVSSALGSRERSAKRLTTTNPS